MFEPKNMSIGMSMSLWKVPCETIAYTLECDDLGYEFGLISNWKIRPQVPQESIYKEKLVHYVMMLVG